MAEKYAVTINGTTFTSYVERDSYSTEYSPVYGDEITTMDGVTHTSILRKKGKLSISLNPQTVAITATLCTALLSLPGTVTYWCLQRNQQVTANMRLASSLTGDFLSRCLANGSKWVQLSNIELEEL